MIFNKSKKCNTRIWFGANSVENNMNGTRSHQTKNASNTTLHNNASFPNTKFSSNENNVDLCNSIIFKVGDNYLCPKCKGTFIYLSNLKRHVKITHPPLMSTFFPPGDHKCNICEKCFKSLRSLQNHSRIYHKSHTCQKQNECPDKCKFQKQHKCPLCPETLRIAKIREHFEKSHNVLLKPIKLNFESYEKFCEWKKAIERVTKSYFVKQSSREMNGTARHTLICHRSGTFKSRGNKNKRKLKAQGSRKMNAYCPAVMKVVVLKEGKCEVQFQSQHLGHENETKHLNLTYEERIYVAEKLATNLPLSDILNDIKNSASKDRAERLCLLTRKDLHNIKASLLKDRQSYLSAAKLDEELMKDLRDIHDKHAQSEHIKADITKTENGWLLTFVENNEIYLIKENSKSCDCPIVCVYCRVCIKSYTCNCSDSYVEGNMCMHIHFFCMERNKTLNIPNSNDHLDCDNEMSEITSTPEQCDSLQSSSSTLAPCKTSRKCKNKNYVDSEKRSALKSKFTYLIDSLTTEEEYKLFESTIEDLATKLKSVHIQSQAENNVVIHSSNHQMETVCINENTQNEHNSIHATYHPVQTECLKKDMKDQYNSVPTTHHPLVMSLTIKQDQHNAILATNHPFKTISVNDNKQDEHNSDSKQINNSVPTTNNHIETANINKNAQGQHTAIPTVKNSFQTVYLKKNTQDTHNSVHVTNLPLDTARVVDNKQDQHNSNSQKTIHRPLVLKMLKPKEGARICYIHFAKAKNKQ